MGRRQSEAVCAVYVDGDICKLVGMMAFLAYSHDGASRLHKWLEPNSLWSSHRYAPSLSRWLARWLARSQCTPEVLGFFGALSTMQARPTGHRKRPAAYAKLPQFGGTSFHKICMPVPAQNISPKSRCFSLMRAAEATLMPERSLTKTAGCCDCAFEASAMATPEEFPAGGLQILQAKRQ